MLAALKLHTINHKVLTEASFRALASLIPHANRSLVEDLFGDALANAVFVLKSLFVIESVVETVCEFMESLAHFGGCAVTMCLCECVTLQCSIIVEYVSVHSSDGVHKLLRSKTFIKASANFMEIHKFSTLSTYQLYV